MKTALKAALVAVVACGGPKKSDGTEPLETARGSQRHETRHVGEGGQTGHVGEGGENGAMGGAEGEAMVGMPPAIGKFHATLAPRWHARPGPQRMADTCAAMAELRAGADAIVAAAPPEGSEAAAWSASGKQLAEAVAALDSTCKANDATAFESAFAQVHEQFHRVMAAAGGEHEHGEHEHGDHGHDH